MKRYFAAVMAALSVFAFGGCAAEHHGTTHASSEANPSKKTYTRDDLDRSGQAQTGQALQTLDPNIETRRGYGSGQR
jgi:hypothetical protein